MRRIIVITILTCFVLAGCGQVAKTWGGTININLDKGQKLVNASWKESNLWVLTRPMKEGETAEKYVYREYSNYGLIEGKVLINESK